jgi:hypothetical protein
MELTFLSLPIEVIEMILFKVGNLKTLLYLTLVHPTLRDIIHEKGFQRQWKSHWLLEDTFPLIQLHSSSFVSGIRNIECQPETDTFSFRETPDVPAYTEGALKAYQLNNRRVFNNERSFTC